MGQVAVYSDVERRRRWSDEERLQILGDPQAWLADILGRIADPPVSRLDELLPWNWRPNTPSIAA